MRRLIFFVIACLLIGGVSLILSAEPKGYTPAPFDSGKLPGASGIFNKLYVKDTTFHGGAVIDSGNHWIIVDTTFWTDGGADTSGCVQTGTHLSFLTDNDFYFNGNLIIAGVLIGQNDWDIIQWDGETIHLDFDADDDTVFIKAHDTGVLRYIVATNQWEFTESVVVNGGVNYAADEQGDDDYEANIPGITALTAGLTVTFLANTANTDGATLEITSVGELDAILKLSDQALVTGDIEAAQIVVVVWDGSNWQMTSQLAQ